ncbi:hypothetical protein FTX61_03770 [Nitriliruptoraceae bacterium ZYF776]|nr:hypothetical protein [Profundirhabdus halotolerans]
MSARPPGPGDGVTPDGAAPDTPPTGWFDDAAVDAAIRARRSQHDAALRARESATWTGTLTDLAEARRSCQVRTEAGTAHTGTLDAVADDHLVLRGAGAVTVLARAAVVAVRVDASGRDLPATGDRPAPQDRTLDEVLGAWAEDRSPVHAVLRGGDAVLGTLTAVGVDVVSVTADGGGTVHLPLRAIVAVTVR